VPVGKFVFCLGMRILGIDHGTVRIGLALSDELGMLAHPLETVPEAKALGRIPEVIRGRGVTAVVLGLPLRLDGTEGTAAERVRVFLAALRPLVPPEVEIHLRDESLTTVTASEQLREAGRKTRGHRPIIDQAAAAVILQEYLDERAGPAAWLVEPEE